LALSFDYPSIILRNWGGEDQRQKKVKRAKGLTR
jgi:hypothetical protein